MHSVSFKKINVSNKTSPKLSIPTVKNGRKSLSLSDVRGSDGEYL